MSRFTAAAMEKEMQKQASRGVRIIKMMQHSGKRMEPDDGLSQNAGRPSGK
jgi:hypothetical protein